MQENSMRKRNRIITFLEMPLVIILWVFGLVLYSVGSKKEPVEPKKVSDVRDVTFNVIMPEQKFAE